MMRQTVNKTGLLFKIINVVLKINYTLSRKDLLTSQLKKRNEKDYFPKTGFVLTTESNLSVYSLLNSGNRNHIIFLHGGAYIKRGTKLHFSFMKLLNKRISCNIHYIDYEVAPISKFEETTQETTNAIIKIMNQYKDDRFYISGDSAGGGLALAVSKMILDVENKHFLAHFLLSPWLDVSLENKEILEIDPYDVILKRDSLLIASKDYADEDLVNPLCSPIYDDMSKLKNIVIFTGTNDILYPDMKLFESRFSQNTSLYIYKNLPHDAALFPYTKIQIDLINKMSEIIYGAGE